MIESELIKFIQDRMLDFNPTLDVEVGSEAYEKVIVPLLAITGSDFISVDIKSLVTDRLWQENRVAVVEGDAVDDLSIKPLQMALEPLRIQLAQIKTNQSFRNPALVSEQAAEDLASNFYVNKEEGQYARGLVRLYFKNPTFLFITPSTRFYTEGGLSFYPTEDSSLSATQMAANRDGNLYYYDVLVQAEEAGSQYNVSKDLIKYSDGLSNLFKITNLRTLTGGEDKDSSLDMFNKVRTSFTERSITSTRGIQARLSEFSDIVDTIVIGYGDVEMQRDIIKGSDEGHLFASGTAVILGQYIIMFDGYEDRGIAGDGRPAIGDTLAVNYHSPWYLGLLPEEKIEDFVITRILFSSLEAGFTGIPGIFVMELDRLPSQLATAMFPWLPRVLLTKYAIKQRGVLTISDMPGGLLLPDNENGIVVADDEVHVGGAFDIFVRPSSLSGSSIVLPNISDNQPLLSGHGLQTWGGTLAQNVVEAYSGGTAINWLTYNVEAGHILQIETGLDQGVYKILAVNGGNLIIDTELKASQSGIKFKVLDAVDLDITTPKQVKIPFGVYQANDLATQVGSAMVAIGVNAIAYGVEENDILEIYSGVSAGKYTVKSISEVDGRVLTLDRSLTTTAINLTFSIYTELSGVQLPLSRLTKIEILDAANQATGITVPYAEPAMTLNRCCFTGSETICEDDLGFVAPDLSPFEPVSEEGDYEGCYEPHEKCYELLTGFTNSKEVYVLDMTKAPSTAIEILGLYTSENYLTKSHYWLLVAMGKIWVGDAESESEEDYTGGPWGFNWGMTTWGGEGNSGFPHDILLENWFEKTIISVTAGPYEASGPFRVRRCYSDGCLECDGHVICICLDYNTQFEICLPNHLFDGCNNTFVGLPDINIAGLLDTLEKAVYKQRILEESEEYGYGYEYGELPYFGSYPGYEEEQGGVQTLELLRDIIPSPCLCESEPGDALTIQQGANAGSYIIEELHDVVIDVSLIFDDDSLDATAARYGGVPLHICIAKIEGEFPLKTLPFLSELFDGPTTLKELFGDYYGYIQDYVYTLFGSEQADTFADNIVWDWQEIFGNYKIPTHIGCGQDVTSDWDKWSTYFANIQKEYQISDELMATVIVMLRRLNAFGASSFGQALEEGGWIPDGSGLDDEAFWLGGGLRFDNVTNLMESIMNWLANPGAQQSGLTDLLLKGGLLMWGTVLMLPFSVAYNIASEGNSELIPDKMIIDLNKVGDFIKELLFDSYSVGKTTCKNTARMYFMEPTTIECEAALGKCYVGEDPHIPTLFATTVGDTELLFSASSDVPPYELLPAREVDNEPMSPLDLPRAIRVRGPTSPVRDQMVFTDPTLLTPIQYNLKPGIDELELYEQRFVLPAPQPNDGGFAPFYLYTNYLDKAGSAVEYPNKYMIPGIITTSGINIVKIPDSSIYGFTTNMVGDLLLIEQGPDTGGYRISEVLDGKTAILSQHLTHDTLPIEAEGYTASFGFGCESGVGLPPPTTPDRFTDTNAEFSVSDVGKYITIFGCPVLSYNGSWKIKEYMDNQNIKVDTSMGTFPEAVVVNGIGMWAITLAPTSAPEVYDEGLETIGVVPYRQYYGEPTVFTITDVSYALGSAYNEAFIRLSTGVIDEYPADGYMQPFAIVRPGLQKITSTQMAENEEGGLYYFDVEIVSLGSGEEFNLVEDSRFWPVRGTFKSDGYLYAVADAKYSYSAYEEVALSISPSVLPIGSLDTPGSRVQMVGSTIQLDYQYAPTVTNAHAFIISRDVRTVCASPLVRQFLPAYPILDIEYEGGSTPQVIGDKIREYVNNLTAMDVIQVDELINIVKSAGASYVKSPLSIRALIFDLERKLTGIESQNQLASDNIGREFFGSDRTTYFNVPENVSGLDSIPMGTRIYLKQIVRTGVFV